MEEAEWKRDETPYIVFACEKCKQFMYVKQTQKTKKCLRCRRSHKVSDISNSGEIVNGMTNAVETVKERQHELAIRELGTTPEFRSLDDFKVHTTERSNRKERIEISNIDNDFIPQFIRMLSKMIDIYTKVPYYAFEIFADNYNIPEAELKILIRLFQRKGIIIKDNQDYRINLDDFYL